MKAEMLLMSNLARPADTFQKLKLGGIRPTYGALFALTLEGEGLVAFPADALIWLSLFSVVDESGRSTKTNLSGMRRVMGETVKSTAAKQGIECSRLEPRKVLSVGRFPATAQHAQAISLISTERLKADRRNEIARRMGEEGLQLVLGEGETKILGLRFAAHALTDQDAFTRVKESVETILARSSSKLTVGPASVFLYAPHRD